MSLRKLYRQLSINPGLLVMPGVYDALSARIAVAAGFEALAAGGYAAVGSMLGGPGHGPIEHARLRRSLQPSVRGRRGSGERRRGHRLRRRPQVRQMVHAFEAAGVAGLMIGDQVFPNRCGYMPGKAVVPVEQMLAKLKAALDARPDPDLVIIARTDAAADHGLDAAIERCQLFMEVGVDAAKPQGIDGPEDTKRVIQEIPGPYLATLSQAAGKPRLDLRGARTARGRRRQPAFDRAVRRRARRLGRAGAGGEEQVRCRRGRRADPARRLLPPRPVR